MPVMNVDLSFHNFYEEDLYKVAKNFSARPNEISKKIFEREINGFVSKTTGVVKKLDKAHSKGNSVTYVMGGSHRNHAISFFDAELFTNVKKLNEAIEKKLQKELAPVADNGEVLKFNIVGKTVNLKKENGDFKNEVVAVVEFISCLKVNSYCIINN